MRRARSSDPHPSAPSRLIGSLDGPSKTITVEPIQTPVTAPPPRIEPEPVPDPPPRAPQRPREPAN
jgi:hypothetical protein